MTEAIALCFSGGKDSAMALHDGAGPRFYRPGIPRGHGLRRFEGGTTVERDGFVFYDLIPAPVECSKRD